MSKKDKEAKMFACVEQWHQSGQTQKDFCKEHRLSYAVFQYWLRRHRQRHVSFGGGTAFTSVQVFDESQVVIGSMELYMPNGCRIVFHQPANAALLKHLIY